MTSNADSWDPPVAVDFPSNTHSGYYAELKKVSCSSPGNCTAVGYYYEADRDYQAFTVSSTNGVWSTARTVVFPPNTLNAHAEAEALDVSCPSDGNCTVIGYFADTTGAYRGFIVSSSGGAWSTTHTLDVGFFVDSVSCVSAGNCAAVGNHYAVTSTQAITLMSVGGVWGQPQLVSFPAGAQNSETTVLTRVSCGSVGSCTAIGYFANSAAMNESFTVTSTNGTWGTAHISLIATGSGSSRFPGYLKAVSCVSDGRCSTGGRFTLTENHDEIFVMSSREAPPAPSTTSPTQSAPSTTASPVTSTTLGPPTIDTVRSLPAAPTPIVADDSISTGETITVSFGGFTPFEYVQLVVASTPQVIGSGYANSQGVVTISGNLPQSLAAGTHTLVVYAPASGTGFSQPITVTAPSLPATGRHESGMVVALWLLVFGVVVSVLARRRFGRPSLSGRVAE